MKFSRISKLYAFLICGLILLVAQCIGMNYILQHSDLAFYMSIALCSVLITLNILIITMLNIKWLYEDKKQFNFI